MAGSRVALVGGDAHSLSKVHHNWQICSHRLADLQADRRQICGLALVDEAMADTRVVLVNGARQSGKSTLVKLSGDAVDAEWCTFDDADIRAAARDDPRVFVAGTKPMIIDELQRVPDLLLSIKARVLWLRTLPGRMETIELWPFAQGRRTTRSFRRRGLRGFPGGVGTGSAAPAAAFLRFVCQQSHHPRCPPGRRDREGGGKAIRHTDWLIAALGVEWPRSSTARPTCSAVSWYECGSRRGFPAAAVRAGHARERSTRAPCP